MSCCFFLADSLPFIIHFPFFWLFVSPPPHLIAISSSLPLPLIVKPLLFLILPLLSLLSPPVLFFASYLSSSPLPSLVILSPPSSPLLLCFSIALIYSCPPALFCVHYCTPNPALSLPVPSILYISSLFSNFIILYPLN